MFFLVAYVLAFVYARKIKPSTPTPLAQLEKQKTELLGRISAVGDLRRGSISTTSGKCGKPTCHCAKPGDAGHGPNHRLTRKVQGKTVTETFASPAALRKAQDEVAEFHHFQDLCEQVVVVSEGICRARPVEDTLHGAGKKQPKRSSVRPRGK